MSGLSLLAKLKGAVRPQPEPAAVGPGLFNARAWDGRYILGALVAESVDRDTAIAAILAAQKDRSKLTLPVKLDPVNDSPEMANVPLYMRPGSYIVYDSTQAPGPYPIGGLQRLP